MKVKVKESIKFDDGKYQGKIKSIEYKDKPYEYVDFIIEESKTELEIKCGVPMNVSENTMLGIVLENFGCDVKKFIGQDLEIEDYINPGVKVQFLVQNKKTEKGVFSNIVASSLKPLKE